MLTEFSAKLAFVLQCQLVITLWYNGNEAAESLVSVSYDSCNDQIGCSYKENVQGECYIEYRDDDDDDEPQNVTIRINSVASPQYSFVPGSIYPYRANITTSSTIVLLVLRGNFTPGECYECDESRITEANATLIALGLFLWLISLIASVMVVVIHLKFINEKHVKTHRLSRIIGICGCVFLLLTLPFWIAIGPVVRDQSDFCDSDWKQSRDGVIAFSFILSFIGLVLLASALVLLVISFRHVISMMKRHPSIFRREELVMEQSGKYSSPDGREDFTIKTNPVFGYDLSTSTDSSKTENASTVDVVGIRNLNAAELTDSTTSDAGHAASTLRKSADAEIIGNRYAS